MALRRIITQQAVLTRSAPILARSFSNSPLPDDVLDMSINGLQISQIGAAIMNHFKLGSVDPPLQPLGRWKIEVDNFADGHKYAYDHSA